MRNLRRANLGAIVADTRTDCAEVVKPTDRRFEGVNADFRDIADDAGQSVKAAPAERLATPYGLDGGKPILDVAAKRLNPHEGPLRVEFATELRQLPPLAERWEALNLCRSDHDAPFFQSYAWNHHVARVRAQASPDGAKPLVATVWRGADLIGVWPLALTRAAGSAMARRLDDPFGQFAGVLFRDSQDIGPGIFAIVRELRHVADGLIVESVIGGSPLHTALLECGAHASDKQQAVFVDIGPFSSFKDYEQNMKGETRRRLRNRTKRLRQAHPVEHLVTTDGTRLKQLINEVFDGRVEWLHRNGRTSSAFRDEIFRNLLTELPGAPDVDLIGFALTANQVEISTHWGFVYAGRYYWYMSAMKDGYDEFSPGLLHLGMIIEACIERGLQGIELMPPASRYKLEWSDKVKDIENLTLPLNFRGRAVLQVTNKLMPAARQLSRMLPDSLRKSIIRRLNRT
jgi:CelD/BcsL family acetyltransferase involved in cellulose biosynthesis